MNKKNPKANFRDRKRRKIGSNYNIPKDEQGNPKKLRKYIYDNEKDLQEIRGCRLNESLVCR